MEIAGIAEIWKSKFATDEHRWTQKKNKPSCRRRTLIDADQMELMLGDGMS